MAEEPQGLTGQAVQILSRTPDTLAYSQPPQEASPGLDDTSLKPSPPKSKGQGPLMPTPGQTWEVAPM